MVNTSAVVHVDKMLAKRAESQAVANGMTLDEFVQDILVERLEEPEGYDAYVREKVLESMSDNHPAIPFHEVVKEVQSIIDQATVKAGA